MAKILKLVSLVTNKLVLLALLALFFSQVWISYGKLAKRTVAYDQDIISNTEQLYPSFTLCPEYNELTPFNYEEHGLDQVYQIKKVVFNDLDSLGHYVKFNQRCNNFIVNNYLWCFNQVLHMKFFIVNFID